MSEKRLITSFFLANAIDSTSTSFLLTQEGWQELNNFAADKLVQGEFYEVLILKMAVTAVLIGTFAVATQINSRLQFPLKKSLQLGNLVVWGVLIWNGINVLASILASF